MNTVTISEERFKELLDVEERMYGMQARMMAALENPEERQSEPPGKFVPCGDGGLIGHLPHAEYEALKADAEKWRDLNRRQTVEQIMADTELGALVRRMPTKFRLERVASVSWTAYEVGIPTWYGTPEDALNAVLKADDADNQQATA